MKFVRPSLPFTMNEIFCHFLNHQHALLSETSPGRDLRSKLVIILYFGRYFLPILVPELSGWEMIFHLALRLKTPIKKCLRNILTFASIDLFCVTRIVEFGHEQASHVTYQKKHSNLLIPPSLTSGCTPQSSSTNSRHREFCNSNAVI